MSAFDSVLKLRLFLNLSKPLPDEVEGIAGVGLGLGGVITGLGIAVGETRTGEDALEFPEGCCPTESIEIASPIVTIIPFEINRDFMPSPLLLGGASMHRQVSLIPQVWQRRQGVFKIFVDAPRLMSPFNCNETLSPCKDGDHESERVPTGESD
jgi:hypothetical protein